MSEGKGQSAIAEIKRAKKEARSYQKDEERAVKYEYGIGGEVWTHYGELVFDYDEAFSEVLTAFNYSSIRNILSERKVRDLGTNILDLMGGSASFLRDLKRPRRAEDTPSPLETGLCVTLVDGRGQKIKDLDEKLNIHVLPGDLTSKKTWDQLDQWQKQRKIEAFDIIVCRGEGGLDYLPEAFYPYLFGKVWERLSRDDGLFITQLPKGADRGGIIKPLESITGIKFHFQEERSNGISTDNAAVGIMKTLVAPERFG